MISVVGEQQISMLPVTEEDFRKLADGEINEIQLEREAKQRIAEAQATTQLPVSLEDIWEVPTTAPYLKTLGCKIESNLGDDHDDPGIADGTVLTVNRAMFDQGIESLGANLRFATCGEASFDALLESSATWKTPSCIRRIAVKPTGLQNDADMERLAGRRPL